MDKKFFHIVYLIYEIAGLWLICLSGKAYAHYGMVLIPMLVYPFSILLSKKQIQEKSWILAFTMYFFIAHVAPTWIGGINKMMEYCLQGNNAYTQPDSIEKICNFITENSNKDDKIIVWGNWNIIYILIISRIRFHRYAFEIHLLVP